MDGGCPLSRSHADEGHLWTGSGNPVLPHWPGTRGWCGRHDCPEVIKTKVHTQVMLSSAQVEDEVTPMAVQPDNGMTEESKPGWLEIVYGRLV
ncbi:hypothetical protein KIPB_015200 [Kipferlia bialata]|uniref:Uncharacterized protein n=1 Tax=Kipferlia bialata TaxID=797122 RepID=A0A391PBQ0_9EUKA|nr:hypothetical protein KIPB_015200 [Kipferlia bialata]|eukprot:g15200.t1